MKAILEFDFPEEREEFKLAQDGGRYLVCLEEIREYLRQKGKHGNLTETEAVLLEEIRKEFYEITEGIWE